MTRKLYKKNIQSFSEIHDKLGWQKTSNYAQAYSFTKYLIERVGKQRFFKFVSKLEENGPFDKFINKVKASFQISFSDLEKDWLNKIK